MDDEDIGGLERGEKRRQDRAALNARKKLLEQFIRLPEHQLVGLDVSPDVEGALLLMRRLKPSGARMRIIKNLSRRADDEDWESIERVVRGYAHAGEAAAARDEFMTNLRDRIIAGDDVALENLRADYPSADHRRLRQLALMARRHSEGGVGKGARKKLIQALRALHENTF